MNESVQSAMKVGVVYTKMQLLSEEILLNGLKDLGILEGDVQEMHEKRVCYLFMPHGLGHLIVQLLLDLHSVYLNTL
jgi:hypothetical protein